MGVVERKAGVEGYSWEDDLFAINLNYLHLYKL